MTKQRAQSMVEFAFIFPIFLMFVMGIFDVGRGVWAYSTTAFLARDIARRAAMFDPNLATYVPARCSDMLVKCSMPPPSPLPPNEAGVLITCGSPTVPAVVTVTYRFAPFVGVLWGGTTLDIPAIATMFVEPSLSGVC